MLRKLSLTALFFILFVVCGFFILAWGGPNDNQVSYGVTFSKFRTDELKLDWREVYDALVYEMGVKKFRFVAHWHTVEPQEGTYDFSVLDHQMRVAEEVGADVILAVGRRLPSWPECHEPEWVSTKTKEERNAYQLRYVTAVVERYKNSPALLMWQVENEPFIVGYAYEHCGETDTVFLEKEIALVKTLDPHHPVLLTASGELGVWNGTYKKADVFGTTLYRSVWSGEFNMYITYPTTPSFFRAKRKLTELLVGEKKPVIIAELASEPWPKGAIIDTPLEEQLRRMNVDLFNKTLTFASRTNFSQQYLWGAEWWYYLKEVHKDDSMWERAKEIFTINQ
ncbi:hypothetical protein COU15_00645 [Candidatus Kaiserbacteria bacterium CG10_big_fil_rev_8_21_14_0_10_45_20]|uniref:Glycoside hydrolase family 42 N-terminal domain-containing protein n=1 Tax=Candidatus Kaiserbacteria bacterium CG10_big_fil_rev_8_21_14_0_10_45_20 TaxID=1974607 RepID=A0A2H0UGE1_9BACT|nr:MAG: hypothetical protein COU15_00645 [Candidatus Kaiserbacteria bacterium CG10_big_fil_rev_8_21_14_0_10_45_20]